MASENEYIEKIDKLVSDKIEDINNNQNIYSTGRVTKVYDYTLEVVGLKKVRFYEKVRIEGKCEGYVLKLDSNRIIIALLSVKDKIHVGDMVYQTNQILSGSFSEQSLGKIIDMFGTDKLVGSKFADCKNYPIFVPNVPIMDRIDVNRPLETGIIGIDLIYPIGKGQRQLIIGDKKTGKTQLGLDIIANQKNKDVICIYCAIGKLKKEVKEIYYELLKRGAMDYTIILTSFYDDMPSILSLTPYFATSIAHQYMMQGKDVLIVMDDLKRNAEAYREICLNSGSTPGRDAYPADIFYFHSRLLENGCQHKDGGSITIIPIVETKGDDITDYISTNIISITDGQLVLSSKNFNKGEKPAIDYGLSVSRLGGNVQTHDMKVLGAEVRHSLLSYLETREIYELANVDEISEDLRQKLFEGRKILDCLIQYKYSPLEYSEIVEKFQKSGVLHGKH